MMPKVTGLDTACGETSPEPVCPALRQVSPPGRVRHRACPLQRASGARAEGWSACSCFPLDGGQEEAVPHKVK